MLIGSEKTRIRMRAVGISPSIMPTEEKMPTRLHSVKKKETQILQKRFKLLYLDGFQQLPTTLNLSNMKLKMKATHCIIGLFGILITLF